jgi:hypothetical protein
LFGSSLADKGLLVPQVSDQFCCPLCRLYEGFAGHKEYEEKKKGKTLYEPRIGVFPRSHLLSSHPVNLPNEC